MVESRGNGKKGTNFVIFIDVFVCTIEEKSMLLMVISFIGWE